VAGDLACVEFGVPPQIEEYVAAARRLAGEIGKRRAATGGAPAFVAETCHRIADLGLDEMIADREATEQPLPLLFLAAEAFGYAALEAAWAGLASVPLGGALIERSRFSFGLPPWHVALSGGSPARWLVVSPDGGPVTQVLLACPDSGGLAGPIDPANPPAGFSLRHSTGLLGFSQPTVVEIRGCALDVSDLPRVADIDFPRYLMLTIALLGGLIDGATRRLVDEAYGYARTRQSGGRILLQHQAVALRLAELAINQQALHLYLFARLRDAAGRPPDATHVGQLAFAIARDAVQIAGAHGYVEGLPFRRLFEQVRSLTSALSLAVGDQAGSGGRLGGGRR
jgi:hypothetical protein